MASQRIKASEYSRHVAARLQRARVAMEEAALETALEGVHDLVARTDAAGLVDQGQYRMGWDARPIPGGGSLGNSAPHTLAIEYGRRPGKGPPLEPLKAWVIRKLGLSGEEADGAALAIQRKIRFRGQKPKHIFTGHLAHLKKRFRVHIRNRLKARG
jgi:hypothetical protein